jgi:hypothetical protein
MGRTARTASMRQSDSVERLLSEARTGKASLPIGRRPRLG